MLILQIDHRRVRVLPLPDTETKVDGLYYHDAALIYVSPSIHPVAQAEILLHEIIHAIWAIRGLPNRLREEGVCAHLAPALATVIQANPALCEALERALRSGKPLFDEGE